MERITSRKNPLLVKIRKLAAGSGRDRREAGERGKKILTNTRRGIRLVFVDFFWKQGENTMGPVRCHRFSRFFSLRFTARAYFPWKQRRGCAVPGALGVYAQAV